MEIIKTVKTINSIADLNKAAKEYQNCVQILDTFGTIHFDTEVDRNITFKQVLLHIVKLTNEFNRIYELAKLIDYLTNCKSTISPVLAGYKAVFAAHSNIADFTNNDIERIIPADKYNGFRNVWESNNAEITEKYLKIIRSLIETEDGEYI